MVIKGKVVPGAELDTTPFRRMGERAYTAAHLQE
jgi:hypothetical protein